MKLHVRPPDPPFHVVLVEPEIPQNTGNIARLCVATSSPLHLCGRLGFRIDEHAVRRAGLDYWKHVRLTVHPDFSTFRLTHSGGLWLMSSDAERSYLNVPFAPGDALVFGKETVGLPRDLLDALPDRVCGIPMSGPTRSLNLANAAGIVLYEALRRTGALVI